MKNNVDDTGGGGVEIMPTLTKKTNDSEYSNNMPDNL